MKKKQKRLSVEKRLTILAASVLVILIGLTSWYAYNRVHRDPCGDYKAIMKKIEPKEFGKTGNGSYSKGNCQKDGYYNGSYSLEMTRANIIKRIQENADKAKFKSNGTPDVYPKPTDPKHPEDSYTIINFVGNYRDKNYQVGLWIYSGSQRVDKGSMINIEVNRY
jgi:hypothetical protein